MIIWTKLVMKKNQNILLSLSVSVFLSISIAHAMSPELSDAKISNAQPNLTEKARFNVPSVRAIMIESNKLTAYARSHYVSIDGSYETLVDTPMENVATLTLTRSDFTVDCSGTLLSNTVGDYVLTAAHCVSDEFGNNIFVTGAATFERINGTESIAITSVDIHPDWDGSIIRGNDVAVLTLTHRPGAEINSYDIERINKFDVGSISEKIGYGLSLVFNGDRISAISSEVGSSIEELAGGAHVAIYAGWIDSITGGSFVSDGSTQTRCNLRQQMLGNC